MKLFVVFSALMAVASASSLYLAPAVSSQYHSQDGIGQYAYGYNDHLSTKQETKSLDGTTRGGYTYIDSNNVLQTVNYVSDAGGFRVTATNLPKPVEAPVVSAHDLPQQVPDTLEVAAAKSAHLAAVEEAKQRLGVQQVITVGLPQQVQDTPEVAKAKAEHFAAIQEAKHQIGWQSLAIPAPIGLPQPVQDTPEVAKAKAEHFAAIQEAKHQIGWQSLAIPAPIGLPQPVQDTPEVAKAKAEHFAAIQEAKHQIGWQSLAIPAPIGLPQPVQDTPEVAKAKAEHLLAIEQAKLRSAIWPYNAVQSAPLASPIQLSASGSVPLPPHGFSYSSSLVNTPVLRYGYYQV